MGSIQTCGNVIRDLRLRRGLTQLQLAELASVSERTIRSAEKNQRISRSHVSYIAEALGVAAIHIARSPTVSNDEEETSPLHRLWGVMFGRVSAISLEAILHREIQIHSCGEGRDFPRPEQLFRRHAGIEECVLFIELISEYFNSLSPFHVSIAELWSGRSAMALQGTVSGTAANGSSKGLQLISFAILEDGLIHTFVNHITSVMNENFTLGTGPELAFDWSDLAVWPQVGEQLHFVS
jgi:transcriptional regulator with XRE-family HTH domain